jgi:hypothetical protein
MNSIRSQLFFFWEQITTLLYNVSCTVWVITTSVVGLITSRDALFYKSCPFKSQCASIRFESDDDEHVLLLHHVQSGFAHQTSMNIRPTRCAPGSVSPSPSLHDRLQRAFLSPPIPGKIKEFMLLRGGWIGSCRTTNIYLPFFTLQAMQDRIDAQDRSSGQTKCIN